MDLKIGEVCFGHIDPGNIAIGVDIKVVVKAWSIGITQNTVGLIVFANFIINNTYNYTHKRFVST